MIAKLSWPEGIGMTRAFELLRKYEQGEEERNSEWQRITSKINEVFLGFDKYLNDNGRDAIATVKLGEKDKLVFRELSVENFRYEEADTVFFALQVSLNKSSSVVAQEALSLSCSRYHAGYSVKIEGVEEAIIVGGYRSEDTKLFEAMYRVLEGKFSSPES
jgi:hypothetical protein